MSTKSIDEMSVEELREALRGAWKQNGELSRSLGGWVDNVRKRDRRIEELERQLQAAGGG